MSRFYLLIETSAGAVWSVYDALKGLKNVDFVDVVVGGNAPFDIIARVDDDDLGTTHRSITENIYTIPGVIRASHFVATDRPNQS